uniref:RNA polymerase II associated protein 1 n=1 Tax=Cyclopterus lumpus TaxID=8103 RepID=A0A8C3A6V4_CYCLU
MLRRPKPSDCEADLLREQEKFLTSGAPAAANVIRRPDKRRGEAGGEGGEGEGGGGEYNRENEGRLRDVVTIEDLPDQLPSLTPAPPKKSRFKASHVTFEDEDAGERLDHHDMHVSAVLSRIVERDTSSTPISLPAFTGMAFPKALHRSETSSQTPLSSTVGKKSIFARQIATNMDTDHCGAADDRESLFNILLFGQGLGAPDSSGEPMRIHRENQAKLQAMSQSEILQEQKKLLCQLDPRLVDFVRSRKAQSVPSSASASKQPWGESSKDNFPLENMSRQSMDLLLKPQKEWVHMDKLEPEKLEWMRDLPAPKRKGTKKAMQARFDFTGSLIPPTEDLPTHLGLHHHGEEPERAGYSLQELFLLSRSQLIQQRSLALGTLSNILSKARAGEYLSVLKGSVVSTLLDAGLLFLLRFALDDGVEGVMSAAVHALKALLVCEDDEECLDCTFSWFRGLASFPLLPSAQEEEEEEDAGLPESMKFTAKEKEERKTDHDVARQDVVKGLLKMKLLPRLRYILEVFRPSPRVVQDVLQILTRIARHSSSSIAFHSQVLECPRLMETVLSEFLPASWTAPSSSIPQSVYGLPLASAMKLLRVLATSGRHTCARLLNSLAVKEHLPCLLSTEPSELLLEPTEALRITTEAYRLWAVAAGYGQACTLYMQVNPFNLTTRDRDLLLSSLIRDSESLEPFHNYCTDYLDTVFHYVSTETYIQTINLLTAFSFFYYFLFYTRSSSVVCNVESSHQDPETTASLPGLACPGWRGRPGLVAPSSPFPLLTALGQIPCMSTYFSDYDSVCYKPNPPLMNNVSIEPEVAKHASLYHQVALVLLPWLLPGSEYLGHELLSTIIFNKDFISEGHSGGPEAVELGELRLQEETHHHTSPSLQTVGALLREACIQLPSIRGCFLTHLAHLESSVLTSRDALLGHSPWISSHLLPELTGPTVPSDWPFLPLISLYERTGLSDGGGLQVEDLPHGALQAVTHCLQWLLLLEVWREEALKVILPVAKLARLSCVFLCSSDLFLERPVQKLIWGLRSKLDSLELNVPPPGLASFQDLYTALLSQYEAVSFGDRLFGCWVLLPLQRRYSATMRLAVFGEHVGMLRSLGVTMEQLSIPIERFTSPPEDSLPLLHLYFRSLVMGTLKPRWCPVLYVVTLSHVNTFIFSQDAAAQEVEAARHSMLRKIYYLTDKVLRNHLLLFHLPQQHSEFGFDSYEQLPPIKAKRLESVLKQQDSSDGKGD